uniref:endo-polygalacturonase n=1 Tax=Lygus hesperus TaxID=30085 RepID=A0A0A9XB43_LYGHE
MTKMIPLGLLLFVAAASAVDVNDIKQLEAAKNSQRITLRNINVPAGVTLNLDKLKPGTVVEFAGQITFGYKEWEGPLILIGGKNIKVEGKPGHLINCQGERWWDKQGGNGGKKKPKFLAVRLTDSSVDGLVIKNTPAHGISINSCKNVAFTKITLNVAEGKTKGGHNTDGFDVGNSEKIRIAYSNVNNQDDCLAINSVNDITFEHNTCIGGHGISIGSVGGRKNNVVQKVKVLHCKVIDSDNGIRIKTVKEKTGEVKDILFDDVELKNIAKRGIVIQGNYLNKGPDGDPTGGVPITGLTINNVRGNVLPGGVNVYIWVANASNWKWSNIKVTGGKKDLGQKGVPPGVKW